MPYHAVQTARQNDPGKYDRIATMVDQGGPGIDFLIGFLKAGGSEVQSIHFDASKFTPAQAKAWLKKHNFKTSVVAATKEAHMGDYSFDEIREMICDALMAKYPIPNNGGMMNMGMSPCCIYRVDTVWDTQVLVRKSMMSDDETLPDIALIPYTITTDADGDGMAELGDPIECAIQAVPKDGSPAVTIDEGDYGMDTPIAKGVVRNSATDAIHTNSIVRHALSMMSPSDLEPVTKAHMQLVAGKVPIGAESARFSEANDAAIKVGDRVKVQPGKEHEEDQANIEGVVKIVNGPAIGIQFTGMPKIHKWYVPSELNKITTEGLIIDGSLLQEAGARNSAADALHANSIVRHALSMMHPSNVEAATMAHMAAMAPPVGAESRQFSEAVWTTSYINNLPDSAFAVISAGGTKDSEGKTVPRNLRHLPYKDSDGKVDLPHLRNALARLPQSSTLSADEKAQAARKLKAAAKTANVGAAAGEGRYSEAWDGSKSRFTMDQLMASVPAAMKAWAISKAGSKDSVTKDMLHLPFKEPDGTINLDGVRNALARLPLVQGVPDDVKAKAKAELQKALAVGNKNEGVTHTNDLMSEAAWNSLEGETISEVFSVSLEESNFDSENLVVKNALMLGPHSSNGRDYPNDTQTKAAPLFEGTKAYLNHPTKDKMGEPRQVQDLIGEYKNVKVREGKTYGDLHLLDKPIVHSEVIPIVESKPHLAGNSVVVRAKQKSGKDGRMTVEEILAVRSVDFVAEPATTKGVFEGISESRHHEESDMNWSDLTVEALRKERPDLVKELFTPSPTEQLESQVKKLEADVAERDKKITDFEIKEANREKEAKEQQHTNLVNKMLTEAKIPEKVKYEVEKDGKKVFKPHFLNLMTRCESEEEMKGLVVDWEKAFAQTRPISEAKEMNFGIQPVSADKVDALFNALTH